MAKLMRLYIDGKWTVNEFADTLQAIQQLYDFQAYCRWLSKMNQGKSRSKRRHQFMEMTEMMGFHPSEAEFFLGYPLSDWRETSATLESISATTHELRRIRHPSELHALGQLPTHLDGPARVTQIHYSSPGVTDIAGVGEIIGHVKDLILSVAEMILNRDHRTQVARQLKLENDKSEIEMIQTRLEAINKFIEVARNAGFSKKKIRTAIQSIDGKVELLAELVSLGKITSVELIDEETAAEGG